MITVVSGHRRSGTSMMMKALHVGGLPALYNKSVKDHHNAPDATGYIPNPSGVFEIGYSNSMTPGYLRIIPDDLAVKLMWDALPILPKGDWKIIFMERNEDEINASCKRVDEYIADDVSEAKRQAVIHKGIIGLPFSCFRTYNQEDINHVLGIMESRKDVELIKVQYQDVLDNPKQAFEKIKYTPLGKERIPIEVAKAAAAINPELRRVRQ